jgi:hypothetical protein
MAAAATEASTPRIVVDSRVLFIKAPPFILDLGGMRIVGHGRV